MIIIEGPDNSGKSTLASFLAYELGMQVYHAGGPPASIKEMNGRVQFILNNSDQFIFDRCPLISEPVYSILRPGGNMFGDSDELYKALRELKPVLIYCRPPDNIVLEVDSHKIKAHDSPSHIAKVTANMAMLVDRYDHIMQSEYLPPHIRYDYTSDGHDNILQQVRDEIIRLGHYKGKELRPSDEQEQRAS